MRHFIKRCAELVDHFSELGNGDMALVDSSLEPRTNSIIVTTFESELVIRRYVERNEVIELYRESLEPQIV
jgi:hypothetical protein